MPTVSVPRDRLFSQIGKTYTESEFDELCFQFGLELDDVTEESLDPESDSAESVIYKIEVPANRYDLLCIEGLAQAIRVFEELGDGVPEWRLETGSIVTDVQESAGPLRPYIVGAVLRGIKLDREVYQSFIDLQEKLHQNICRRRTLVAIGTHDLATIQPPFRYECRKPQDIRFVPLNQEKEVDGKGLMELYESDPHLKKYLPIIRDAPKYPVLSDSNGTVLSLPPIINGNHSKITLDTRDIFVECTATDHTKAIIVLNIIVAMFSRYCEKPFSVEPVTVKYSGGKTVVTPDFSKPTVTADLEFINRSVGIDIDAQAAVHLLRRTQLPAHVERSGSRDRIVVKVPIIRSDVMHACDIMADVAIAYGFNEVPEGTPATYTVGYSQPINALCDAVRHEGLIATGYTEVLTWVTVSHKENFDMMRRMDDGETAVRIGNPKTLEFEECRTSLLPGLLKTLRENRKVGVPIQIFEVGDVVLKDKDAEVRAVNRRRLAAVRCATSAGFEVVKGLLDHVMRVIGAEDWHLKADGCADECFFEGRRADIWWKQQKLGAIGWIHPQVLDNFNITYPCSALELDLEPFL